MSLPLFGIDPVSTIRSYSTDNSRFVLTCQNELDKAGSNQPKPVFMTNLRRLRLILPILLSVCAGLSWADDYPRTPGLDVLHYTFRLELSDATDEIIGETTVVVRFVSEGGTDFHLDLIGKKEITGMTVSAISEDGEPATFTHEDDRIHISPLSPGKAGERRSYTIRYRGVPADGLVIANNKHGERTFSADNWPNKTHHWLPTLDHPYDKATCEFVIAAPDHYQVVANGLKLEETNLAADRRRTHWKQSVPIATWLMVISVARYAVQYVDDYQGTSIQTWVFPRDRDAGFYDFARAKRPLAFFSSYIGPYSYEKLANVQVTAPVGATEAATSIFYQQDFVTGDRERENTITHEIAHHWFGNAVTEDDWDHVWLSEGFATYFTLLFIEYAYGRDRFVEGLMRSRERVFEFYKDNPDYHIVHDNLTDMSKVTTRNTYQKGAWVLHMLRGLMGDESFWAGIREYYRRFRDTNASTQDFRHVMEEFSGEDLSWFFHQWLYQGGKLEYRGRWSYDGEQKQLELELDQVQTDGTTFRMPVEIGIYGAGEPQIERLQVDERKTRFTIALEEPPTTVVLDPNSWVLMESELARR